MTGFFSLRCLRIPTSAFLTRSSVRSPSILVMRMLFTESNSKRKPTGRRLGTAFYPSIGVKSLLHSKPRRLRPAVLGEQCSGDALGFTYTKPFTDQFVPRPNAYHWGAVRWRVEQSLHVLHRLKAQNVETSIRIWGLCDLRHRSTTLSRTTRSGSE